MRKIIIAGTMNLLMSCGAPQTGEDSSVVEENAFESMNAEARTKVPSTIYENGIDTKTLSLQRQALEYFGEFQGSFLIARGEEVLAKGGGGSSLSPMNSENTPKTKFRIGSCTKSLTALAIMQLVEANKLRTDDLIGKFIPGTEGSPRKIHHLLTHTSGISDYAGFNVNPQSTDELIEITKQMPINFEAGQQFEYSNSNFSILGAVIEKLSGKSFGTYLQEHVFSKSGMSDSGYGYPAQPETGYAWPESAKSRGGIEPTGKAFSAGAAYSTVEDLHKWAVALRTGSLISKPSLSAMRKSYVTDIEANPQSVDPLNGIGYGVFVGREFFGHEGAIDSFRCSYRLRLRDGAFVVVLGNGENESEPLMNQLLELLVREVG